MDINLVKILHLHNEYFHNSHMVHHSAI
jgi:hypothetical protein